VFINVLSHQPDGQLLKQHNIQTQKAKDNKQGTKETDTDKINEVYLIN
jgi:hypothetical protein